MYGGGKGKFQSLKKTKKRGSKKKSTKRGIRKSMGKRVQQKRTKMRKQSNFHRGKRGKKRIKSGSGATNEECDLDDASPLRSIFDDWFGKARTWKVVRAALRAARR